MLEPLELLGLQFLVGEELSLNVLKKAYFVRAKATHPDKNPSPNAKEIFQSVLAAYEALNAVFEGKTVSVSKSYSDLWQELHEIEKEFENCKKQMEKHGQIIAEHGQIIQEHGQIIQAMTQELAKMTQQVADIAAQQHSTPPEPVQHSPEPTIESATAETHASLLSELGHFSHSAPPPRTAIPEAESPQPEPETQTL